MPQDLILTLPDPADHPDAYERAVRQLRDHLVGAVEVDRRIGLNGRAYVVAWGDRRPAAGREPGFSLTPGMRVIDHRGSAPAEVVPTGEEQITLVVDGERLVFHLVEDDGGPARLPPRPRRALR